LRSYGSIKNKKTNFKVELFRSYYNIVTKPTMDFMENVREKQYVVLKSDKGKMSKF